MRWLAGLVLGSTLLVVGGAHAAAPTTAQLVARHAPILVLHPAERFAPTPVETFLADSVRAGARLDNRFCFARDGFAALDCYDGADAAHTAAPVVYGAAFRAPDGRLALEYWLPLRLLSLDADRPAAADFWQAHEGEWEAVAVLLDASGRPESVATSRHCSGARRAWAKTERRGLRPVVYVALGSHAAFRRCISPKLKVPCGDKPVRASVRALGAV